MRLAVYSDFPYRRHEGRIYAEQAFALFLVGLREHVDRLVLLGRLDPLAQAWHFELPASVEYEALPHYPSLAHAVAVLAAVAGSLRRFWHALDDVDTVLLFGPNPLAVLFALLAALRGRQVALGARQDYVPYIRSRYPGRLLPRLAARLLDGAFRLTARRHPLIVVGPHLADRYPRARRLGVMTVSLVSERDLEDVSAAREPHERPGGPVAVLSVGRLDREKNPMLLADALALLRDDAPGFTLRVCGDGPLEQPLRERLQALRVASRADLRGFVPVGAKLKEMYRSSDVFLHSSLTEGVPQVLFEAFAAGLPVVATDVGAVAATVGDAALLVPPGDPHATAAALRRLATEPALRSELVRRGAELVRGYTLERCCRHVVDFLEGQPGASLPSR
jgi:glycosyltransferase involved in cell wall biosynthesis